MLENGLNNDGEARALAGLAKAGARKMGMVVTEEWESGLVVEAMA